MSNYELFKKHNLEKYYQFHVGNIVICLEELTSDIKMNCINFILENNDFVLGSDDEYMYICEKDYL